MELPARYRLRVPALGDLDAVAGVLIAGEFGEAGQIVLGADFLRAEWSRAGFNLATDAWVVVDGAAAIVGYVQAKAEESSLVECWGVVHPGHRRRGIGSVLLDLTQERASGLLAGPGSGRFRHAINAGDRAAAAMLQARGLRLVRHFWHMQIDLAGPVEPGSPPEGIKITGIEPPPPGDLPVIHAVVSEAFADHWGHQPEPFDRWAGEQMGSPGYDPGLWLLATAAGQPGRVGALAGQHTDVSRSSSGLPSHQNHAHKARLRRLEVSASNRDTHDRPTHRARDGHDLYP